MRKDLIEKRGEEWHVCRMENSTMKVWVGKYKTEAEARIAHDVAVLHNEERSAWIKQHGDKLAQRIKDAIAQSKKEK